MSPLVWDLAHIGNQEELWLWRAVGGREALRPEIDSLYDAFEHPRSARPSLPLLAPGEARTYAADVRLRVLDVLERAEFDERPLLRAAFAFGLVAQHEQQHDETMLITHQLRKGPAGLTAPPPPPLRSGPLPAEVLVPGGPFTMGTSEEPWALDNERPAHVRVVPAFHIDTAPVTNGAYRAFMADGGYTDRRWWRPEGWAQIREHGIAAPLFWRQEGAQWLRRRFGVTEPVPEDEPVLHVSWYEADAYACWAGRMAADRGRVGEGRPVRPGIRALAPLSVGRRRSGARARQPRAAAPASGRRGQLSRGRVSARRTAVDR